MCPEVSQGWLMVVSKKASQLIAIRILSLRFQMLLSKPMMMADNHKGTSSDPGTSSNHVGRLTYQSDHNVPT